MLPSQRERWHFLLSKPKRRHELLEEIRSGFAFEAQKLEILAPENGKPERILEISGRKGAPVGLRAALEKTVGTCENTLLICPNARLAFWESEGCQRAILNHRLNKALD